MGNELDMLAIGNCVLSKVGQDPNLKRNTTRSSRPIENHESPSEKLARHQLRLVTPADLAAAFEVSVVMIRAWTQLSMTWPPIRTCSRR
jgi:hypothetical protein